MLSSNPLEGTNTAKTLDFGLLSLQHCETVDRGFTQSVVHYYNNPSKLYKRESVVISTFLFLTLIICAFSLSFFLSVFVTFIFSKNYWLIFSSHTLISISLFSGIQKQVFTSYLLLALGLFCSFPPYILEEGA